MGIAEWGLQNRKIAKWEYCQMGIAKWEYCQMGIAKWEYCQMGMPNGKFPNGNIAKWEYTLKILINKKIIYIHKNFESVKISDCYFHYVKILLGKR